MTWGKWSACHSGQPVPPCLCCGGPCTAATLGHHRLCWWQQEAVTDNCHHHRVRCWHLAPTAFSSRAMGMGTQPDGGWVLLMLRGRPDSSTGRRRHRFLFAMVSQAWFSRGGEHFSVKRVHILWRKMSQHFKDDRSHWFRGKCTRAYSQQLSVLYQRMSQASILLNSYSDLLPCTVPPFGPAPSPNLPYNACTVSAGKTVSFCIALTCKGQL